MYLGEVDGALGTVSAASGALRKVQGLGLLGDHEEKARAILTETRRLLFDSFLRRTRHSRDCKGSPLLVLPPLKVEVVELEITKDEMSGYAERFERDNAVRDTL